MGFMDLSEFGTNYFRERMGQVLYPVLLLSLIEYKIRIATEKVQIESSLEYKC